MTADEQATRLLKSNLPDSLKIVMFQDVIVAKAVELYLAKSTPANGKEII